jgi:hypothetical protein
MNEKDFEILKMFYTQVYPLDCYRNCESYPKYGLHYPIACSFSETYDITEVVSHHFHMSSFACRSIRCSQK